MPFLGHSGRILDLIYLHRPRFAPPELRGDEICRIYAKRPPPPKGAKATSSRRGGKRNNPWLTSQALCCLLLQSSGIAQALPLPPEQTFVSKRLNRLMELDSETSAGDVLQSYHYTLGPAGNRTRIDKHDGTSRHYSYDDLYRLTQDRVIDPAATLVYQRDFSYDPVGNRLEQVVDKGGGPATIASTYDTRDRQLTADAISYGWDIAGNLTSKNDGGVTTYQWDFENRLTSVTLVDGSVVRTTYDADGNRVRAEVAPPGEPTRVVNYLIDTTGFLSHVVAEVVDGSVQALYTRADDQLIGFYRPASATSRYYHSDGLGSVRMLSYGNGAVADRYNYSAFGEPLEHAGTEVQPYQFVGEPYDPNVGFYFNRARWLDVVSGRFTAADPFLGIQNDPSTLHKYFYANGNPVNHVDPSGLVTLTNIALTVAVGGVLGAIAGKALTGTIKGAAWGGAAGAILGLSFLMGPAMFIRGVIYGLLNTGFLLLSIELLKKFRDSEIPVGTALKEALVQSFAAGAAANLAGGYIGSLNLRGGEVAVAALSGAIGSAIGGYKQGQGFMVTLFNALLGFVVSGTLAGVVGAAIPGIGQQAADELASLLREVVNAIVILVPTLLTASGMEFLRQQNPRAYRFLTS